MDQQRINPYDSSSFHHLKRIMAKKRDSNSFQRRFHLKNKLSLDTDNAYSQENSSPTSYKQPQKKVGDISKRYQTVENSQRRTPKGYGNINDSLNSGRNGSIDPYRHSSKERILENRYHTPVLRRPQIYNKVSHSIDYEQDQPQTITFENQIINSSINQERQDSKRGLSAQIQNKITPQRVRNPALQYEDLYKQRYSVNPPQRSINTSITIDKESLPVSMPSSATNQMPQQYQSERVSTPLGPNYNSINRSPPKKIPKQQSQQQYQRKSYNNQGKQQQQSFMYEESSDNGIGLITTYTSSGKPVVTQSLNVANILPQLSEVKDSHTTLTSVFQSKDRIEQFEKDDEYEVEPHQAIKNVVQKHVESAYQRIDLIKKNFKKKRNKYLFQIYSQD